MEQRTRSLVSGTGTLLTRSLCVNPSGFKRWPTPTRRMPPLKSFCNNWRSTARTIKAARSDRATFGKVIGANTALQTKLIAALHDSALEGHSGITATYQRVRKLFAWPGLKRAVEDFMHECLACQQAKHEHCHPVGKLQPLPVPLESWHDLMMDFVERLPNSEGHDSIMVVVDRLTKFAHFVPLRHPFTAAQVARAFWDSIIKLHGVPHFIVSDCDKIFTSAMWRELLAAAGTKLLYSAAYHPRTDGQSEHVNQCLEMYLRCAVQDRPKQWQKWLPAAKFWYNSTHHSSLMCSPFKALYGHEPNLGGLPVFLDNISSDMATSDFDWAAHTEMLQGHLTRAQDRFKKQADKQRTECAFTVGDQVLLKLQPYVQVSVASCPCRKLAYKYFGRSPSWSVSVPWRTAWSCRWIAASIRSSMSPS